MGSIGREGIISSGKSSVRTQASPEQALVCSRTPSNRLGSPLPLQGVRTSNHDRVSDRRDAWVGLSPDLNFDCERTLVEDGTFSIRAKWRSSSAGIGSFQKPLDIADIVRDACLQQLSVSDYQLEVATAASRTPPWPLSEWGCLGRRLSRGRRNPGMHSSLWRCRQRVRRHGPGPSVPVRRLARSARR
jgi:hypothetical protein